MNIPATAIEQDGPGIDLTDQPEGLTIQMADPVTDFVYARNMVTLTYDLSGAVTARLSFEAMEFGDEPHFAKDEGGSENRENLVGFGPLDAAQAFDGVALSVDGVDWYEIQDLRRLRSDRFTGYDLDLNAIAAGNDRDFSGPDGFVLGGLGTGYASGSMDEFRVYDRALFEIEIAALAEV